MVLNEEGNISRVAIVLTRQEFPVPRFERIWKCKTAGSLMRTIEFEAIEQKCPESRRPLK